MGMLFSGGWLQGKMYYSEQFSPACARGEHLQDRVKCDNSPVEATR